MITKFLLICLLFFMMGSMVESHQNPNGDQPALLHRQKRSKELIEKLKKYVVSSVGGASKSTPDHSTEKDSETSGSSHSFFSTKGKEDDKHSTKHHYGGSEHSEGKEHFDASKLIKNTLYTILETLKAVGGAATAISGKLIKLSGYGVSLSGKLISASGDPITSLGKKIALKAMLVDPSKKHLHGHGEHGEHGEHGGHGGLSGYGGHDDFSNHIPNELVEFNHQHDVGIGSPYVLGDGFDNQLANIHEPYFQYGAQWPVSYLHKRTSKRK